MRDDNIRNGQNKGFNKIFFKHTKLLLLCLMNTSSRHWACLIYDIQ